jgi:hypothetical protein
MAGTTRLETRGLCRDRCNRLISNGVGGHLLILYGTVRHFLSSPYCTQILVSLRKLRHPCTYAFAFHSRFFELDCYSCAKPAPTNNSISEMWRLSSDARNPTGFAISSGAPSLPDSFRYLVIRPEQHCLSAASSVNTSRLRDTHRRSHARFLLRLVQQATEEMQWVSGSFHLQTKLRTFLTFVSPAFVVSSVLQLSPAQSASRIPKPCD